MTAIQANLDETKPVRATGVRGPNSKPFARTFRNMVTLRRFLDNEQGNVEVTHIEQDPSVHPDPAQTFGPCTNCDTPDRCRDDAMCALGEVSAEEEAVNIEEAPVRPEEHSAHFLAYIVDRDVNGVRPIPTGPMECSIIKQAPIVIASTPTRVRRRKADPRVIPPVPVVEQTGQVHNLTDYLDPAKARETVARRDAAAAAAQAPKGPKAPGRLAAIHAEWNALVPAAQAAGIKCRVLTSLHENVAAGEKRLAWLKEAIEAATAPKAETA